MGITIALLSSMETCIVQIQSVWVKFACTKRLFNLSAEAIINVRNASHLCNIPFEEQTNSFFLSFGQGFTFLTRVQSQFKMLLEMSIVLASIVSTERNANLMVVM